MRRGATAVIWVAAVHGIAVPAASHPLQAADLAKPLSDSPPDAARGRSVVFDRTRGNCTVCHVIAAPGVKPADVRFHGNLGPALTGIGARLDTTALRMRLVDSRMLNPKTIMPPYHSTDGLVRAAKAFEGKPILTAMEIEDVVAYLSSLKE